jgi:hypothetical protein
MDKGIYDGRDSSVIWRKYNVVCVCVLTVLKHILVFDYLPYFVIQVNVYKVHHLLYDRFFIKYI